MTRGLKRDRGRGTLSTSSSLRELNLVESKIDGGGARGGYDVASSLFSVIVGWLTSIVERAGMILSAFLHAMAPFLIASKILGAGNCNKKRGLGFV